MGMRWIITEAPICAGEDRSEVGTQGTSRGVTRRSGGLEWYELWDLPYEFRLRDDDQETYYYGRSNDHTFAPLHDFALPNDGATEIQYRSPSGTWETL